MIQRWRGALVYVSGEAVLRVDDDAFDYHVDIPVGYSGQGLTDALEFAERLGLEAMDPDECEPDYLDDGKLRIWLTPIVPVEDGMPGTVLVDAPEAA